MPEATRPRPRTKAAEQTGKTKTSQRRGDVSSDLAQRDLMAAVLDAAVDGAPLEDCLPRIAAHLQQYSQCRCAAIMIFEQDSVACCMLHRGHDPEFRRSRKDSFPASRVCSTLGGQPNSPAADPPRPRSFRRNNRLANPTHSEERSELHGICVGSMFESVALVPITRLQSIVGFILMGDEHKDRVKPDTVDFLERLGRYLGSTMRLPESKGAVGPSKLPPPAESAPVAPKYSTPDEMELVTRLIDAANESIVVTQDWRIIYVNNKCAEMAGMSKQDMMGLAFLDITHPDDQMKAKERYSRILNGEWYTSGTVLRGLDKDGNTRWAELREIPFTWHGRPAVMSLVNDITDRKRAEEALARSEAKYRQLVETLDEGVGAVDENAKMVFVNPRLAEMFGYTPDEMVGRDLLSFLAQVADEAGVIEAPRKLESRRQGASEGYEARARRKDGTEIYLSVRSSPILDSSGKYTGAIAAVRDVTDQKKAEQALRQSERHYRYLADNTTDVIWVTDLHLRPSYFSPSVEELMGYTVEEAMAGTLETRVAPASAELAAKTFTEALAKERRTPESTKSRTMELELKRKGGSTVWVETTVTFTRDSGGQVVGILGTMRDITDRRRAREALRASEEKYRLLAEKANDLVFTADLNLRNTYVSPSVERVLGFTVEEYSGLSLARQMTPWSMEQAWEAFFKQVGLEQDPETDPARAVRLELEYYRKDGSTVWLENVLTGIRDANGTLVGVHGVARDVTDRRKAQEALKRSETKYKNLFEHTLLGLEVVDGQTGKTALANRSLARMFGFKSPADMVGTNPMDYVLPEDVDWVAGQIAQLMADPTWAKTAQIRARTEDGRIVWLTGMGTPIDYEDQPAMLLSLVDITAAKEAEIRLHQSEERYRLLVETANEAIVVIQDGLLKFVSPKIEQVSGYTASDVLQKPFADFVHPDDLRMVADRYARRLKGEEPSHPYELRFLHKTGITTWAEVSAVLFDWEGRPATLALVTDITERKQAYEALQHQERLFRAITENSSDLVVLVAPDGEIRYESPAVERILGFTPKERVGANLLERIHPEDSPTVVDSFRRMRDNPQAPVERHEVRLKHKNGSWRTLESAVSVIVRDSSVEAVIVNLRDITERKKAEDALRASEERFRTLIEESADAIAILDAGGHIVYESPSMERVTGYRLDDWKGTPVTEWLLHPDDIASMASLLERLIAHPELASEEFRVRFKHSDGTWHVLEGTTRNLLSDPKVNGIVVNYRDVTQRIRAEQDLKDSEERFRTIIENAQDAITIVDENFGIIYESPSLARVTGYAPDQWVGKGLGDLAVHPDDLPIIASSYETLRGKPGSVVEDIAVRYKHADGSWHVIEATGRNLLNDPRVEGIVVNFRDITTRTRMEEALRKSELRYRLLAENASDVIFTSDLQMNLTYVSPSIAQLTGYTAEETLSLTINEWAAPASREFILQSLPQGISSAKSGIDLPPASRTATLEMQKKAGGTVFAEVKIDFLRDQNGQPDGIIGVARDITDRRIAEMELAHRVQLEMLIGQIATAFIGISTEYTDQGVRNALEAISEFTGVDWSCIFILSTDGTGVSLEYEWRSKDAQSLPDRPDSLDVRDVPWLAGKIKEGACIHVPEVADLPAEAQAEKSLFLKQGMRSIVVIPILQAGNAIGFLGLSSIGHKTDWHEDTIMLLRLVAEMFSNVLERQQMESALRESEKRYRLVANNVTDVIWTTDMQTNITYMSPSASALLGYAPHELTKLTVADLLTPDSLDRGMKVFAGRQQAASVVPDQQPDHWTLEVELRRKDGSTVWAEEKVTFLRDEQGTPIGLLGVTRDISQRKAAEDALRVSEEKYRTLVEASPDGVLSIDNRGIITDCNTGLCRMLGYDKDQLRGREASHLAARKDSEADPYFRANPLQGQFKEVETELVRHNSQTLPVWAKVVSLSEPSAADTQTVIYFRDIEDRRKIDEMKDEFIGLVSHELRSPLTVIIGALHTAISEGPRLSQKETRQLLEDAALEAEQLSHLVGNLLELSRAQANRLFLHVEPVSLAKAIHRVIESIQRQSPKHKFVVDLPRKMPPVSADQLRLERILYNLLENSVKYSPEGSEITVSARREAGHLVVSVTDLGPGISREDQAKLFKPFQQLGSPMLDHTKGAGLGLLVCRRLVEAHGGRIWVESEPDHGATFRFTLEAGEKNGADVG